VKLVIGSDHAGFPMKAELLVFLRGLGHEVQDVGSYDPNPVDFPDIAREVASAVTSGRAERGLMVCGTGVGAAIGANKMKGIRCRGLPRRAFGPSMCRARRRQRHVHRRTDRRAVARQGPDRGLSQRQLLDR